MTEPITVVIAADPMWRSLWREELAAAPGLEVVGEVDGSGIEQRVVDVVPDVVLVHTDIAGLDIVDLCQRLSARLPVTRVVLVAGARGAPYEAVAAGAAGAVHAAALAGTVADAVARTARGEALVTQEWAERLLQDDGGARLTATEREVLQRVARGSSIDAVAGLHEVPPRLVHLHAGYAMAKVHRAAEDAREAGTGA